MKIVDVRAHPIAARAPNGETFGTSEYSATVVELDPDDDLIGIGEAIGRGMPVLTAMIAREKLKPLDMEAVRHYSADAVALAR